MTGSVATVARLGEAVLPALPDDIVVPAYDRAHTRIGIVHIGVGAFHRAHQAVYVDDLLVEEPGWAICGVSLHGAAVRDALQPQQGLYTLALLGERTVLRVIGSIKELLYAPQDGSAVLERLADPSTRLVTLTITEKGYCLSGDALDLENPEIIHDLASPETPVGAIGYLVAGLRRRRQQGLAAYTVLSCDNLADNGGRLRRAVLDFAHRIDPSLAAWIEAEVGFPRSMVDSITPATDDGLRARVSAALGVTDAWPVQRERYSQWVVEDDFRNGRPQFERAGVLMSSDIAGFDRAKLRLLNAPHSAFAYLGSLMGVETVADAMREPALAGFVARLMREDIAPTLALPRWLRSRCVHHRDSRPLRQPGNPPSARADRLGRLAEDSGTPAGHDRRCIGCRSPDRSPVPAGGRLAALRRMPGAVRRCPGRST